MSDGATMSAPASTCDNGRARDELERGVVLDAPVLDHAAVAVTRVLAEAHVGDDEQVGDRLLDGANRLLDDPVLRVGFAPPRVLLLGQPEQEHGGNAQTRHVLALPHELVDGEPELARHRRDGFAHAPAVDDEQGVHQLVGAKRRLTHHLPDER